MKSVVFMAQSLIFYRIYLDVYGAEGETRTNLYKPHYKRVLQFYNLLVLLLVFSYFISTIV
jgi:hypothetical protein